jgi:hypothetical protein
MVESKKNSPNDLGDVLYIVYFMIYILSAIKCIFLEAYEILECLLLLIGLKVLFGAVFRFVCLFLIVLKYINLLLICFQNIYFS